MNKKLFFLLLLGFPFYPFTGSSQTNDSSYEYTNKHELASVSYSDKNGTLIYERIYWNHLPNGKYAFVSKQGFVTVRNGSTFKLDASTPDNVTETTLDDKYNEVTYIWKNGKREIYTGGLPDGTNTIKYEGDNPGVYEWKNGKEIFVRKLTKEDRKAQEQAQIDAAALLKIEQEMQKEQQDTTKQQIK